MTVGKTTLIHPPQRVGSEPAPLRVGQQRARGTDMVDPFGRTVSYLRLSVTDRCDLRCTYCMAENMSFLPKKELLTLEELDRLASAFVARGVRKLRITGGEPLVRRGMMTLFEALARHLRSGALDELTLTTNATQLAKYADQLAALGIRRVNISLDTRDRATFERLTRRDQLSTVLDGIDAALEAGLKVKINTVALKHDNAAELADLIAWAHSKDMDMTLIEAMPMGEIEADRFDQYLPLTDVHATLSTRWKLTPLAERTGGPARYHHVEETGGKLGLITPLSHNFCADCNRVRVTCTGRIYMCLGQEDAVDLRAPLRNHPRDDRPLGTAIDRAIGRKPEGHDFRIDRTGQAPAVPRHMSVTGG